MASDGTWKARALELRKRVIVLEKQIVELKLKLDPAQEHIIIGPDGDGLGTWEFCPADMVPGFEFDLKRPIVKGGRWRNRRARILRVEPRSKISMRCVYIEFIDKILRTGSQDASH